MVRWSPPIRSMESMEFYMQKTFLNGNRAAVLAIGRLLLILLLLCCESTPAADKFKPFKLKTLDGTTKTLQDFANKATLVAFYYPTCAYCNLALPEVLKIYDKYKDQGLSYVIINVKPQENKLIAGWQEKYNIIVPVLIGASQDSLIDDYHLTLTPTHHLLGIKGEVLLRQNGYNRGDEKTIEAKIQESLNVGPESANPAKQ
jgi:peroxiredoxin